MREVMKIRATKKRPKTRCIRGDRAIRIFEAGLRKRANTILGPSRRPRSFEQIYEQLARLRSWEARDLRKAIATHFSLA